jgi:hypothetical protein
MQSESSHYTVLNRTFPLFEGRRLREYVRPWPRQIWLLKSWSVLIHPWNRTIPTSLKIRLIKNQYLESEVPLFTVAEPIERPIVKEFRERLSAIEQKLGIDTPYEAPAGKLHLPLRHDEELYVEIIGPEEDFEPIYSRARIFELHLCGLKMTPQYV